MHTLKECMQNMRKVFLSLREKMASFARRYPCGVMACGVICVLLSLFLFEGYCFPRMLFPAVCLLLAGCVFSLPDAVWKFAFPGLLVWGSFLIYQELRYVIIGYMLFGNILIENTKILQT